MFVRVLFREMVWRRCLLGGVDLMAVPCRLGRETLTLDLALDLLYGMVLFPEKIFYAAWGRCSLVRHSVEAISRDGCERL